MDVSIKKISIMGILNATPDSFFDKGSYFSFENALERGREIYRQGADILDIGGASSRPGAGIVEEDEELRRVVPLIEALSKLLPIPISIDTCRPEVAEAAIEKGARLINDIGGFQNPKMRELAAGCQADLCLMHMQGTPQTMQQSPSYPEGVVEHIIRFFEKQIESLVKEGVKESRIILDPGIGFGKTLEHNIEILKSIGQFKSFGLRVMIGASRKGFMTKMLKKPPTELLPATLAIHTMAMFAGADIIRVHDVLEHRDIADVFSHFK